MTKSEHISLIKHRIGGHGDKTQKHDKVIEAAADRAWNQLISDTFRKNLDLMTFYCKEYKDVQIQYDSDTDRYYCTLPEVIVQLPDFANGVRRISSMKSHDTSFYPVSEAQLEQMESLEVNTVSNDIPFVVRTTRVEFGDITALDYSDSGSSSLNVLRMSLVIPFSSYADTDEIPIPAGKDEMFINTTTQFLLGTPDRDNLNDNI